MSKTDDQDQEMELNDDEEEDDNDNDSVELDLKDCGYSYNYSHQANQHQHQHGAKFTTNNTISDDYYLYSDNQYMAEYKSIELMNEDSNSIDIRRMLM